MQVMRLGSAYFLLLIFSIGTVHAGDTGSPSGDILKNYAMQKNSPLINQVIISKLRSALESHVSQFISQPRWTPYHEWFGIRKSSVAMTEPADVFYALSLAFPYLPSSLQQEIRTYLRNQWSATQPYNNLDYPNLQNGAARNWHPLDPDDYIAAVGAGHPVSNRRIQIYPIYLFAENTNSWDLVSVQYNKIKAIYNSISPILGDRDDGNNSRNIASLFGFIRIADKLNFADDVSNVLNKLESMVETKINHQRSEGSECATAMDSGHTIPQWKSGGCLYTGNTHHGSINIYYGMVPELGRILRDYATTASENIENWINRNGQGYWLVNGDTPIYEGEVNKPLYITTMSYFHLMSDIQAVDFDRHRQLVDMPACRADVYYIERLVRAIEASAPQNWIPYSVPSPARNLRIYDFYFE